MDITNALIPYEGFLPSRTDTGDLWVNINHKKERSWEEAVVGVYAHDNEDFDRIYGEDGKELGRLNIGGYIDIYIQFQIPPHK